MPPISHGAYQTPFGPIGLRWQAGALLGIELLGPGPGADETPPDWLRDALDGWFAAPGRGPTCPIRATGTAFQHRVWDQIAAIPAGETRTYGALAAILGSGARAVGGACRANPVPLLVPCHRVVGAHDPGGFAGDRTGRLLDIKRWLLTHEGARWPA